MNYEYLTCFLYYLMNEIEENCNLKNLNKK